MLKLIAISCVLAVVAANAIGDKACLPSVTKAWGPNNIPLKGRRSDGGFCSRDLIFAEEFDTLNEAVWIHETGGNSNGEFQLYVNDRTVSYASDGSVKLRPTIHNDDAEHIWSARMTSINGFSFTYGFAEVRAKVPAGDWLWPAIWMMPRDSVYGGWPASGEIDIMESKGNAQWVNSIGSTLHWGPDWSQNRYYLTTWGRTNPNSFHDDFHRFQVEWHPDFLRFLVDDEEIGAVYPPGGGFWELGGFGGGNPWTNSLMAPFDQPFYFILNVAVGGTNGFFADNDGGKPWNNGDGNAKQKFWDARDSWLGSWNIDTEQAALVVDYVHAYSL